MTRFVLAILGKFLCAVGLHSKLAVVEYGPQPNLGWERARVDYYRCRRCRWHSIAYVRELP